MVSNIKTKLTVSDLLIVITVIAAPMTTLRVWKIGVAEACAFIWCIGQFVQSRLKIQVDFYVKSVMLISIFYLLGFLSRLIKGIPAIMVFDEAITILFFMLFIAGLAQYLKHADKARIIRVYNLIYFSGFLIYFGLFMYSVIFNKRHFLGNPLWYYDRLSILAANPHQFVFFIVPVAFSGLIVLKSGPPVKLACKAIYLLCFIGYLYLGFLTESSTLMASLLVMFFHAVHYRVNRTFSSKGSRTYRVFISLEIVLLILTAILGRGLIWETLKLFFSNDVNGLGRITLWKAGLKTFVKHPFIGLGPGAHLIRLPIETFAESHNVFIDIAIRGGIIPVIIFLRVFYYSWKNADDLLYKKSIILFFLVYGFGGYILRRITLWFYIMTLISGTKFIGNSDKHYSVDKVGRARENSNLNCNNKRYSLR